MPTDDDCWDIYNRIQDRLASISEGTPCAYRFPNHGLTSIESSIDGSLATECKARLLVRGANNRRVAVRSIRLGATHDVATFVEVSIQEEDGHCAFLLREELLYENDSYTELITDEQMIVREGSGIHYPGVDVEDRFLPYDGRIAE